MIRSFKIKRLNLSLTFRHRFEKKDKSRYDRTFRRWEFGFWFEKNKMVGTNNFNNPKQWGKNLVNSYMIGVEGLIFKAWISFDIGGMRFKEKDKKYIQI